MPKQHTSQDRVKFDVKDQIAFVTLNRADKLNALDIPMFEAIAKTAKLIKKDKSIRAVILSGDGKAFCSGLDVKSMFKTPTAVVKLLVKPGRKASNLAQDVSYLWRELPIPVIAVTHGKCWGGGFQIALGADFRFSSEDCTFSIMETKWGLIPDMAGSLGLRELCGIDRAKELTMTARIFDANEALNYGLITDKSSDPMKVALKLADEIKAKSPDAISYTKVLYNTVWLSTVRQALLWETKLQRKLIGRFNQRTSISRNSGDENAPEFKQRR